MAFRHIQGGLRLIPLVDFLRHVETTLRRNLQDDPGQLNAVRSPHSQSLFIVAGPGSGKTTALALRILKLVFVDEINPAGIMATTFTRRAAAELRSRILGWGDRLRQAFINEPRISITIKKQLRSLDLNRIMTGTIDSLAEEILRENRTPGTQPPVVIEEFVANAFMIRAGLFNHGRYNNQSLKDYIGQLPESAYRLNMGGISQTILEIRERILHDQVDIVRYRNNQRPNGQNPHSGVPVVCDAIDDYEQELQSNLLLDFAELENEFLRQLQGGSLTKFLSTIKAIFVDEYQDTNLLQESIYFELAQAASNNNGNITVVGDDDQSLYRFRGATVDLFRDFPQRVQNAGITPKTIYLSQNYRSTPSIVNLCNNFIVLDNVYQQTRVGGKPQIITARPTPYDNYPILGMFRDDVGTLAQDLAHFIYNVVRGNGVCVQDADGQTYTIQVSSSMGSSADCALLCSSPRETDSQGKPRLPLLLRWQLKMLPHPIQMFNPRGQALETIPDVERLCGLMLECLDTDSRVQNMVHSLPHIAVDTFNHWRLQSHSYMSKNPSPPTQRNWKRKLTLTDFVDAWQSRHPLGRSNWGKEITIADLAYKLVTWIPNMQGDIEGLVYLEAIVRTITQAGQFGRFGARIVFDNNNPRLEDNSIKEALWNSFVPLASGAIQINEDLLETLPRDRVNVLSIHQAKGLEFPLTIIDVGADFRNLRSAAFKRFPRNGGKTCAMEDELRPFSPLGIARRSALNRAFDDLIRHYFVAYSRARDVLLLVGLNSVSQGYNTMYSSREIPNIATGWDRNGTWRWGKGLPNLIHI